MKIRSYKEICSIEDFSERFKYLSLQGKIGDITFGHERFLNQSFYRSYQWRLVRSVVIIRDNACDLGTPGREIPGRIVIHHMNPLTRKQVEEGDPAMLDPEYLISVALLTHNAVHYGDESQLPRQFVERASGDTKLW